MATDKLSRTELKLKAQENIAHMISLVFQYVTDNVLDEIPEGQYEEFHAILEHQADRAVRLMGYEKHWRS
ncbi:hypothetical protein [Streptomyces sp. PsTaAH-124]|uniref:hypothetical protein n=1 Tax=Streptomyces sp. PsTaAH-124 TaxID=1157638 RepID=UPI00131A0D9C|nr:hypothetical protein [Streptomyces sp. PsTaAH-124]